jgi:hypothetical protein
MLRQLAGRVPANILIFLANFWPPFLGAGIRVVSATKDYRTIKVRMNRSWYNANYVGTQFGGSLYAMTDPFYMLMLINILGPDYIVWDKAAQIEFKKPGRTAVFAEFHLSVAQTDAIKAKADQLPKYIFDLPVNITTATGEIIAAVTKTIYIRRKQASRE